MKRRQIRVVFPCTYIIPNCSLPHTVCGSLEFLEVLALTCLTWTGCDLLTSSPADVGIRDHQALSPKAFRHARRHVNEKHTDSPAVMWAIGQQAADSLTFTSSPPGFMVASLL